MKFSEYKDPKQLLEMGYDSEVGEENSISNQDRGYCLERIMEIIAKNDERIEVMISYSKNIRDDEGGQHDLVFEWKEKYVYFECKWRKDPIGSEVISELFGKNPNSSLGLITMSRVTNEAMSKIKNIRSRGIPFLLIERKEVHALVQAYNPSILSQRKSFQTYFKSNL